MEPSANITANLTENSSDEASDTLLYTFPLIGTEYYKTYNIYLYLMIALGVFGNIIVLIVFCYNRPSNTTDWFILSITACDFISSSVNVPVYATFTNGYWRDYGTTFLCRFQMFLSQSIVLSSSFLICGLALDRYLKVCRHSSSFTTSRARNVCISITVVTTVLSIPSFLMYENRGGYCVSIVMGKTIFIYFLLVFFIFLFATFVVVFSYFKVTKAVINSEANLARHTTNSKEVKRNECFGRLFPFNRKHKVVPSTITMSRTGHFRENTSKTFPGHLSHFRGLSDVENERDQLTRSTNIHTISKGYMASVSGQFNKSSKMYNSESDNQMRQRKSTSLKTTKISFLVCSVFIVTWIPPWLCFILASIPDMKSNTNVLKFMMFGKMTYLINGFSNPIIYTLLNKKFRSRILEIFCCYKY